MATYERITSAMPKVMRETVVTCRFSLEERAMLGELAEADGISSSDVLRMLVRRAHASQLGPRTSKKPAKKK